MASAPSIPLAKFSICLIEDNEHRLLFLKRSADTKFGAGQWGFPGGHIEANESPLACARREIAEELGFDNQLELCQSHPPVRDSFYGGRYEVHLFHFRWRKGVIALNHEHSEFQWVGKNEFSELDVVLGVDEDIFLLGLWPTAYLNPERLPTGAA